LKPRLWRFRKDLRQKIVTVASLLLRSALSAASGGPAATYPPVEKQETDFGSSELPVRMLVLHFSGYVSEIKRKPPVLQHKTLHFVFNLSQFIL
jgi:hypothetical protein